MVSKGEEIVVLWPRYFDASLSRAQGRRVPASLAVRNPGIKMLETATRKLGLEPIVEADARDPATPWEKGGRVLVDPKGSKEATIRLVAQQLNKRDEAEGGGKGGKKGG